MGERRPACARRFYNTPGPLNQKVSKAEIGGIFPSTATRAETPRRRLLAMSAPSRHNTAIHSVGTDGREPQPITDVATGSIFAIDNAKDWKGNNLWNRERT